MTHDRTSRETANLVIIFLAVLLVASVVYVAAYFALVGRTFAARTYTTVFYRTDYRYGGQAAATIFWPINQLDRRCRVDYWSERDLP